MKNKPASVVVVPLEKALNGIPPSWCDRTINMRVNKKYKKNQFLISKLSTSSSTNTNPTILLQLVSKLEADAHAVLVMFCNYMLLYALVSSSLNNHDANFCLQKGSLARVKPSPAAKRSYIRTTVDLFAN